jgi:hypothetical protein
MRKAMRFGRRLALPSTVQIKHQLLMLWLKDQTLKEATEAAAAASKSVSQQNVAPGLAPL